MKSLTRVLSLVLLGSLSVAGSAQISNFKHVVIVLQENRTPDNLFYGLCQPPYGSDSTCSTHPTGTQYNIQTHGWFDKSAPGGTTEPMPVPLNSEYDLGHLHHAFVVQCDKDANGNCMMDGAASVICSSVTDACTTTPHPQFKYADNSTGLLNPYFDIATQYGWANFMFSTHQGGSYAGHLFMFGGTAAPSADDDHAGTFVSDNGNGPTGNSGCLTPNDGSILVQTIDANGVESPSNKVFPCFEYNTLTDLLETKGVSWRYYSPGTSSVWTAPTSINHLCQPGDGQCQGADWQSHVDPLPSHFLDDVANCNLQQVSWVIPLGQDSDHAGKVDNDGGPAWVASIINALGNSYSNSGGKCDYWGNNTNDSTAIIVTWDDWGGWYDHQAPLIMEYPQGGYQRGFRVPLMVVSAYTPVQYVTNNQFDFGSIIRFIEQNYGIDKGALTFADARSLSDLRGFFNLNRVPRVFVNISSPRESDFYTHDTRLPDGPDDE